MSTNIKQYEYPLKTKRINGGTWAVVDQKGAVIVKAKCEGEAQDIADQMNRQKSGGSEK